MTLPAPGLFLTPAAGLAMQRCMSMMIRAGRLKDMGSRDSFDGRARRGVSPHPAPNRVESGQYDARCSTSCRTGVGRRDRNQAPIAASRRCQTTPAPITASPMAVSATGKSMLSLNTVCDR